MQFILYTYFMIEQLGALHGPRDSDESFSLAVIRSAGGVILGRKTRGFGTGKLMLPGGKDRYFVSGNGVGLIPGRVDVAREVREETGLDIDPIEFEQRAVLHVYAPGSTRTITAYQAWAMQEPLQSTDELTPLEWHNEKTLPYDEMPDDYRHWLPHVLAGYAVTAFFNTTSGGHVGGKVFRQQLEPLGLLEEVPVPAQVQ
jgi:8-oxo-dGTP diphosphatase